MNTTRIVAFVLIIAGILALAYGSFSYTKDSTPIKVGPLAVTVKKEETVNIPMWAGIAAVVVGGLLIFAGAKRG